ncbi:ubiquitin-protein ligase, partial [Reticulomyxa filosa]
MNVVFRSSQSFHEFMTQFQDLKKEEKEEEKTTTSSENEDASEKWMDVYVDQFMKIYAFVSQTQSDLWKRNGSDVFNIVEGYEKIGWYPLLKGSDVGGLYQALEWNGPSNFITKFLYFYQLHDWLDVATLCIMPPHDNSLLETSKELWDAYESGWVHWCDLDHTLKMVESLLINLISLISEPTYRVHHVITLEQHGSKSDNPNENEHKTEHDNTNTNTNANTNANINANINEVEMTCKSSQHETELTLFERQSIDEKKWLEYELVHWLVLGKATYSELVNKLSMLDEEIDCKPVLERIAVFQAPQGLENAKYCLKDHYYIKFNPYFHKYTVEERQQALEMADQKLNQIVSNGKDEGLLSSLQWPTVEYSNSHTLGLLGTPWMGTIWTCLLHHVCVNDTKRFTQNTLVHCLRLIALVTE